MTVNSFQNPWKKLAVLTILRWDLLKLVLKVYIRQFMSNRGCGRRGLELEKKVEKILTH